MVPVAVEWRRVSYLLAQASAHRRTFNGSGTSGRVALRLGRRYVGLDLSREYLSEQAIHRIDPLAAAAQDARNGAEQQVMAL